MFHNSIQTMLFYIVFETITNKLEKLIFVQIIKNLDKEAVISWKEKRESQDSLHSFLLFK